MTIKLYSGRRGPPSPFAPGDAWLSHPVRGDSTEGPLP